MLILPGSYSYPGFSTRPFRGAVCVELTYPGDDMGTRWEASASEWKQAGLQTGYHTVSNGN